MRALSVLLFIVVCALSSPVVAQVNYKTVNARQASGKFVIDGKLTENDWQLTGLATDFIQSGPHPGQPSTQRTVVRILYDDDAVYIGAMLYDSSPDSVMKQLTPRDDFDNSNVDAFGVNFDTYFDRQNATQFVVTAAGVQADGIAKFDAVDRSWNAAWYSRVHHSDSGWSVELKIPYAALRFSKSQVQTWGVNYFRVIRRHRERSYWNKVDPAVQNVIGQGGRLDSIRDIKAPIRLALLPYISAYAEDYDGNTARTLNGGMDIKYGLSESFTVDMTLVPDFGQTLFDNRVLNLSPIEVRYDERRYFFTEGMDLFRKNDLFYSRRVGGVPINVRQLPANMSTTESIVENPANSRLFNATKISGRTKSRTGIGFFNALSAETNALVRDTISGQERSVQTAPFTNYNVVVIDQAMRNNSYLSFINTNVARKRTSYDANVAAILFKVADKTNTYGVTGSTDVSQKFYNTSTDVGYRSMLTVGKLSGNYTTSLATKVISDNFNPNDLGYLDRNNIISAILYNTYNTYKPFWIINNTYNKIGLEYYRMFNPDVFSRAAIHGNHNVTFRNFLTIGGYWDATPAESYDYFEPRTSGRFFTVAGNSMAGGFFSSDYRKRFALDIEGSRRHYLAGNRDIDYWSISPRFRFGNKLTAVYSFSHEDHANDIGFVDKVQDSVILGTRNLRTNINSLSTAYVFTRTMSLKLDARHYWSQAAYNKYELLNQDGRLAESSYNQNRNINYNSFNVFMNFVWQFKPGSEMSVVYQNSIYSSGQQLSDEYQSALRYTLSAPQSNSLSVKIIYFLDYQTIEGGLRHRG